MAVGQELHMRRNMFQRFFEDLFAGDPVPLTVVGVLAVIGIAIGLFWWKTARDLRREDEERKHRYRKPGGSKS